MTITEPAEFRDLKPMLLAGLRRFFTFDERPAIPMLWQRFGAHIGHVPDEIPGFAYGVSLMPTSEREDGFDYMAAVAVRTLDELPAELVGIRIPALRWAIFPHADHISTIGATCGAAFEWAGRQAGHPSGAVNLVESYGPSFNPETGFGGCEIWIAAGG